MSLSKLELFPWVFWMSISKLELFPGVAPQHQTTKLQGILNEFIQIGVVPLGCSPTPNYKTTGNFEWVYPNWSCSLGLPPNPKLQNYREFWMSISKLELFHWVPNPKLQNYREFLMSISKLELLQERLLELLKGQQSCSNYKTTGLFERVYQKWRFLLGLPPNFQSCWRTPQSC